MKSSAYEGKGLTIPLTENIEMLSTDLLSGAKAAATFIGESPRTVYHMAEKGLLPCIRGDDNSPIKKAELPQPISAIHIKQGGPLFRVKIVTPQQLDRSAARPETYAGIVAARQAAGWLAKATGLPVVDLTGG